jgi:hypothetical protein
VECLDIFPVWFSLHGRLSLIKGYEKLGPLYYTLFLTGKKIGISSIPKLFYAKAHQLYILAWECSIVHPIPHRRKGCMPR